MTTSDAGDQLPSTGNPHLVTPAAVWGEDGAPIAVLAAHGRTQSPRDMQALSDRLNVTGLRWLAPSAAENSWYPYGFMERRPEDDPWLGWALEAVDLQVANLVEEGYSPERLVLLGFSQGACLLTQWALLHPARYAGLVILTGGYVGSDDEQVTFSGRFDGTPTLLAGCESDPWVPRTRIAETEGWLRRLGCRVTSLIEPGEVHEVTENAAELTRQLLGSAVQTVAAR